MSIESDLFTKVTTNAGVSALIATRLTPLILDQSSVFPAAVYQFVSGTHVESMQGSSGLAEGRLQVSSYGATPKDARDTAEAIRLVLHGLKGTVGSTDNVAILILDGPRDLYEDDTKKFRRDFDYQVFYKEVQP